MLLILLSTYQQEYSNLLLSLIYLTTIFSIIPWAKLCRSSVLPAQCEHGVDSSGRRRRLRPRPVGSGRRKRRQTRSPHLSVYTSMSRQLLGSNRDNTTHRCEVTTVRTTRL